VEGPALRNPGNQVGYGRLVNWFVSFDSQFVTFLQPISQPMVPIPAEDFFWKMRGRKSKLASLFSQKGLFSFALESACRTSNGPLEEKLNRSSSFTF
jgi:hypothetical protein